MRIRNFGKARGRFLSLGGFLCDTNGAKVSLRTVAGKNYFVTEVLNWKVSRVAWKDCWHGTIVRKWNRERMGEVKTVPAKNTKEREIEQKFLNR